jgi:D-lactate dehydrogenase
MKIVFFDIDTLAAEFFKNQDFGDSTVEFTHASANDAGSLLLDADIISGTAHHPLTAATLARFPNLKAIITRSQGIDHIDADFCSKNNIKIMNANGYGEFAVSEFAMGLLLALMRRIFAAHSDMLAGRVNMESYIGSDIHGKTIGVFGTGTIGTHFAKLAAGFGAKVICYDRKQNPDLNYVDLEVLYKESDIIALNIPANSENYHIINSDVMGKMKRGAVLLNVARGELIDARDLCDSLQAGQIGGVAMDVLELENPNIKVLDKGQMEIVLYNEKMMNMPNVIMTPHVAFNSIEANEKILEITMDNIRSIL